MIEITLPVELWKRGEAVGHARDEAVKGGKPKFSYKTTKRTSAETHTYGARGEAAFAHALGLDWPGVVNGFREIPDVPPNWEIRTTDNEWSLKVAPDDNPRLLVAFVLNDWGSAAYRLLGFIKAGWAQKNLPLVDKPDSKGRPRGAPAHWVKAYSLSPIDPGFHVTHGWMRDDQGSWVCAFCPERYEGLQ